MTLPLKPDTIAAAYEYLRATPPFSRWNLPDAEDVKFCVTRSKTTMGEYYVEGKRPVIRVSFTQVGHTTTLLSLVAHEMVHMHQHRTCMEGKSMHNAAFKKLADQVCKIHGFDPKVF